MKSRLLVALFVCLPAYSSGFPSLQTHGNPKSMKTHTNKRQAAPPQGAGALPAIPPPFDPALQFVETNGAHAWQAPGPTDQRGECPGLNALANHGYLPRSGVATIPQFINATYTGLGMSNDLGGFLAVYGALVDGTVTGWSIGGLPHTGILGSHSNYETDSSPLKADLNQYGSNGRLIMSQFYNLYNRQPDASTANYNLEVLRNFRGTRFNESIAKNPYFFYGPFNGIAVSQAAFTFIYRFMSNKSAQYPEGRLDKDTLKRKVDPPSFMSISGPENALTWTPGHERIPTSFYKRHPTDSYSIPYFESDLSYFAETQPEILSIGCNQGRVNSFSPFSAQTLTGGAYTAQTIAQNPTCFAAQFLAAGAVSILGLGASIAQQLQNALQPLTSVGGKACPVISSPNFSQLLACPGFSNYGGPTGPVAPGAIQS